MTVKLYLGDCREILPTLEDNSVDAVITDPPYPKEFQYVWAVLGKQSARILKPRGNLITLLGHYQLPYVINELDNHLRYWWIFWMVQNNINRLIGKGVAVRGKPALWYVKDRRRDLKEYGYPFDTLKSKLNESRESKTYHKWGQSVGWFEHYIEELTKPGEWVLDPFMGSGTTGVACVQTGRNFIGIEIDPKYYEIAEKRIAEAQLQIRMDI